MSATVIRMQCSEEMDILARLASRDPDALGSLYERYGRLVFSIASKMLSDFRESEEVTQDVFLSVWKHAPAYRAERNSPVSWLASITRNKCIDRLRRASRRLPSCAGGLEEKLIVDVGLYADPLKLMDLNDLSRELCKCVAQLPEAQRNTVEYAYFECLSVVEIANRLSLSEATVKSRLRLAMGKLRRSVRFFPDI